MWATRGSGSKDRGNLSARSVRTAPKAHATPDLVSVGTGESRTRRGGMTASSPARAPCGLGIGVLLTRPCASCAAGRRSREHGPGAALPGHQGPSELLVEGVTGPLGRGSVAGRSASAGGNWCSPSPCGASHPGCAPHRARIAGRIRASDVRSVKDEVHGHAAVCGRACSHRPERRPSRSRAAAPRWRGRWRELLSGARRARKRPACRSERRWCRRTDPGSC